jgi:antitoxin (DNA-binding transcriptional repressor) of toxin-antitoxin stability system
MAREVSVRDLRNHTAAVVAALRGGEQVTLTVNHDPVADIVPHTDSSNSAQQDPWVSSQVLRDIVRDAPADTGLLADLADVRGGLIEEP